jgi:hypothetical protein
VLERFNTNARRAIFFALHEANSASSVEITTEHLLMGILRQDKRIIPQLSADRAAAIVKRVRSPLKRDPGSPAKDLPLSAECRRALELASEEAEALGHPEVDSGHLALGLLRVEDCGAAKLLRAGGMEYDRFRAWVKASILPTLPPVKRLAASSLQPAVQALENLVENVSQYLDLHSERYAHRRLKRRPWTRRQAFGHLIDWAIAHQRWIARAMLESKLAALAYPAEDAAAVGHYSDFPWPETIKLWVAMNRLLIHTWSRVPEEKAQVRCRIGIAAAVSLADLANAYVEHCDDIAGQTLMLLY